MFKRLLARSRTKPTRPQQVKSRLGLEILEDRLVLAVRTWNGGSTINNWTNANNWVGKIVPVAGDDLVFPANAARKVADNNFPADTFFKSITVGGGYTLRGARVLLGNGGIIDNSGTSNVINFKIHLGAAGSGNRPFQIGSGSTLFIDDDIVGGNGLNKTGLGNLSFRNNNSYTGQTDIQAGTLFIEKDNSLGSFSTAAEGTIVRNGATLLVNDTAVGTIRTDEPITVEGLGTIRAINDVHLRGNIVTLGQAQLRHEGGIIERLLVTGQISGSGGITIANASGQVWLQGNTSNTYQGVTSVFGKLRLDNSSGNAIPGDMTISGTASGVRYHQNNQIADTATVTVMNGGVLLGNIRRDTFNKLKLVGGKAEGMELDFLDFFTRFKDIALRLVDRLTDPDNASFTVNAFEATSTSSVTAELAGMSVLLPGTGTIVVTDGPRPDDLIANGFLGNDGLNEDTLTVTGGGTIKIPNSRLLLPGADFTTHMHFILNQGHLRLMQDEIDTSLFGSSETTRATVNNGGRFSGTASIGQLVVNAGGRVRPGTLGTTVNLGIAQLTFADTGSFEVTNELTLNPGAILETKINGILGGISFDQIKAKGTVNVTGAILEPVLGPNATVGQSYRIINKTSAGPIVGTFAVPTATAPFQNSPPTGQRLAFNYQGGDDANDLVLSLQNTPPMAPGLTVNSTEFNEGGSITATGRLVDPDPNARLRLYVNWGDGTRQELHRPGRDLFSLSHQYRRDGVYTARFEWLDQTGQGNSREFTITVNNAPPSLTLRTFRTTSSGVLLASGWLSDAGYDQYTATLDFGDGTPVRSKTLHRGHFFDFAHRYQNPGTYAVTITLRDAQGAESTHERQVIIQ